MKERAGEEDLDSGRAILVCLISLDASLACLTLLPRQSKEPTREPNKTSLGPSRSMKHQTNGAERSNNPRRQFGGYDGNGYHTVSGMMAQFEIEDCKSNFEIAIRQFANDSPR